MGRHSVPRAENRVAARVSHMIRIRYRHVVTGRSGLRVFRLISVTLFAWFASTGNTCLAFCPHELLVLVNANSEDSIAVANHFVAARGVPALNVITLDLPASVLRRGGDITPEDFTQRIWEPAWEALHQRGLTRQVRAWIYSAGFPSRITRKPGLSLTGITFLRNQIPADDQVSQARYISPYFCGPAQEDGAKNPTVAIPWYQDKLGEEAPLPAMMLGFTGARGNRLGEVLEAIQRGARSDHSKPKGKVFLVTRDDIRSRCREWQYKATVRELKDLGIKSSIVTRYPTKIESALGILSGSEFIPDAQEFRLPPGAMAEHLTSHAGQFAVMYQTMLTYWIRKGATASCGTVVEPLALWPKFPHARFFAHYGAGCTMIESFYLSIASPLQILLVGEPLARPFAEPLDAVWDEAEEEDPMTFRLRVKPPHEELEIAAQFLIDGMAATPFQKDLTLQIPAGRLIPGPHELRAVVVSVTSVRRWTQISRVFEVDAGGARLDLRLAGGERQVQKDHDAIFEVHCSPPARRVEIVKGADRLALLDAGEDRAVVPARRLGLGPSPIQAIALLPDGRPLRSRCLVVDVVPNETPLTMGKVRVNRQEGNIVVRPGIRGLDPGIPAALEVYALAPLEAIRETTVGDSKVNVRRREMEISTGDGFDVCLIDEDPPAGLEGLSTTVRWQRVRDRLREVSAGIVFNYRDPQHFDVFGLFRGLGLGFASRNGNQWSEHEAVGMPMFPDEPYVLSIEATETEGLVGRALGHGALRWSAGGLQAQPIGFLAGKHLTACFSPMGTLLAAGPLPPEGSVIIPDVDRPLRIRLRQGTRFAEAQTKAP